MNRNDTFVLLLILLSILLISCNVRSKVKKYAHCDSIVIAYYSGLIDFPTSEPTEHLIEKFYYKQADTIVEISHCDYVLIKQLLSSKSNLNGIDVVGARIVVKSGSIARCFSGMGYSRIDGHLIKDNLYTLYRMKTVSGYYNYYIEDDLFGYPEIKKYGLPHDYNYYYGRFPKVDANGRPVKRQLKGIVKVILYDEECAKNTSL